MKRRKGEEKTNQAKGIPTLDTTKTGLFAQFCSQGSCRKGTVWEELVFRQRLFSSCTQGSLILLLLHEKKKRLRIPHANKNTIHFEEEMQRSFQEQALLDISAGIHVLCEMEPLVPE